MPSFSDLVIDSENSQLHGEAETQIIILKNEKSYHATQNKNFDGGDADGAASKC